MELRHLEGQCEATKKQDSVAPKSQGAGDALLYLGSASQATTPQSSPLVVSLFSLTLITISRATTSPLAV